MTTCIERFSYEWENEKKNCFITTGSLKQGQLCTVFGRTLLIITSYLALYKRVLFLIIKYLRYNTHADWLVTKFISEDREIAHTKL